MENYRVGPTAQLFEVFRQQRPQPFAGGAPLGQAAPAKTGIAP